MMGLARMERAKAGVAKTKILSSEPPEHRLAEVALSPYQRDQALRSATVWQRACQRLPPSYDDGAADGTADLAGIKVQASVQGEAASSTSVPARSANNGIGFHNVKIAVGA